MLTQYCTTRIGTTLVFPIGLEAISWRLYFIIGAWDLLEAIFVKFCWIETKGLSLEEIDHIFEGGNRPANDSESQHKEEVVFAEDIKDRSVIMAAGEATSGGR